MQERDWKVKSMRNIIEMRKLTKEFNGLVAVDHINLSVREGEVFGFLGPNGAGKTTAIKMLCTILNPTSGSAKVCGYDIMRQKNEVRECIGMVFQDPAIDTFLTGKENLDFHARMYHMDKKAREGRIAEVLDLLDLKGKENTKINDCSGGIQRRFEVARGFVSHPDVLFLDEPTLGLDIQTRRNLCNYIIKLSRQKGTTIILTTHYIEEADYLCNRIAIMDHGNIVALDMPKKLKEVIGLGLISLRLLNGGSDRLANLLKEFHWIKNIELRNSSLELSIDSEEERMLQIIDFAYEHGFIISSIEMHEPSLEDVFVHYTGKTIREAEGSLKELWKAMMTKRRGRK